MASPVPSLFQCQSSSEQNGQVFTPNIPDLYFEHENAYSFRISDIANLTVLQPALEPARGYFFTLPPQSAERDCSGTVQAVEYCYQRSDTDPESLRFDLVIVDNSSSVIQERFPVEHTPSGDTCTLHTRRQAQTWLCCVTTQLSSENQFNIPSSSILFGVVHNSSGSARVLAFNNTVATYYNVTAQRTSPGAFGFLDLGPGQVLPSHRVVPSGLPLLRFIIGNNWKFYTAVRH